MRAEYVKQKQRIAKAAKKKVSEGDVPQTVSDMAVKGKSPAGKLVLGVLSWKVHRDSFHVIYI